METDETGGIAVPGGVPAAQEASWNLAMYTCESQYTPDPRYRQEWTPEQLGLLYDYWEQYFIPCLAAHGHPVDTTDRPSREAWVAAFPTVDRLPWYPPDTYFLLNPEERDRLAGVCPPSPPDDVFYG